MKYLPFLFCFCLLQPCDFPKDYFSPNKECVTDITFPDSENPNSEVYHTAVLNYLESRRPDEFRYYFKPFIEEGDKNYMLTSFRSDSACFNVKILVENWDKLAGMKRTNGKSYPGELYDLKWEIIPLDDGPGVYYVDMHRIID